MRDQTGVDDVKPELATAVGLLALSDRSVHEAAQRAGITRFELEKALEENELTDQLDISTDGDVASKIDTLLDEHS